VEDAVARPSQCRERDADVEQYALALRDTALGADVENLRENCVQFLHAFI
jgi:hypothetical protein